jgi:hypothetical protein
MQITGENGVVVPLVDGKEELLNKTHASVVTAREFYGGIPPAVHHSTVTLSIWDPC